MVVCFGFVQQGLDDLNRLFCKSISLWVVETGGHVLDTPFSGEAFVFFSCVLGAIVTSDDHRYTMLGQYRCCVGYYGFTACVLRLARFYVSGEIIHYNQIVMVTPVEEICCNLLPGVGPGIVGSFWFEPMYS